MNDRPVLVIIAGPNGSGKTTLTRQLQSSGIDLGFYINPDVIAEGLTGSYEARVAEAQRIAEEQRQDCLTRRTSFAFETVMSHESKIDILRQARVLGYVIVLYCRHQFSASERRSRRAACCPGRARCPS